MQTSKVVTMLAGLAALNGTVIAGELDSEAPVGLVFPAATEFTVKGKETVSLRFAGRVHLDYNSLSNDGTDASGDEPETTNGFYFRRLRFGTKAKLSSGWVAEVIYDFSGDGGSSINTAYVGYKGFKFGHTKVPFGFEQLESSTKIKGIERSIATRQFVDEQNLGGFKTGIHWEGEYSGVTLRAAVTNAQEGAEDISGFASQDLAFYGSASWTNDTWTVGADYGLVQTSTGDSGIAGSDYSGYTGYVNYNNGGFNVLAEYYSGSSDDVDADTDAYNVQVSYKFDKWEPVVRYSYVESDGDIDANGLIRRAPDSTADVPGEITSIYAGVNYYYSKSVKFMAGYEHAEAEDAAGNTTDKISGVRARVQVLF